VSDATQRPIRGSGDRGLILAEALRLRNVATEVERSLADWQPPKGGEATADHVREETRARIRRWREEAKALEDHVAAYDRNRSALTPGEIDSGIRGTTP